MDQPLFTSKYLEKAIDELSSLPGIGRKTALRLALHLLRIDQQMAYNFGNAIIEMVENIKHCHICNAISDHDICLICANPERDHSTVCVVESIREVIAFEHTNQFKGRYHVLGGIISPMDGIGPSDLCLAPLDTAIENNQVKEIILALSTTMEGDTTNYFIYRRYQKYNLKITTLARGVSIGDEIEYTDEITLARSLANRMPFENTFQFK